MDKVTNSGANNDKRTGKQLLRSALDYEFGQNGKKRDPVKAFELYQKCAKLKYPGLTIEELQILHWNLGLCHLHGKGSMKNEFEGGRHIVIAYKNGCVKATVWVAELFEKGLYGYDADLPRAVNLYREAAREGSRVAAYRLGMILKKGASEVDKNPEEAFNMFGIAAKGDEQSIKPEWLYEYALCFLDGFGTKKDPATGIGFMSQAAEAGNADAQYEMAQAYECGWGLEKSEEKRWEWMQRAADGGNKHAEFEFGEHLISTDPELAVGYLQKAADKGHAMAQVYLLKAKEEKAKAEIDSLTRAAERGNRKAQMKLGMMYLKGEQVSRNPRLGFDWLSAAAEQGDMDALAVLGWCYLEGTGVPRPNEARAFECFEEAAGPIKKSKNRRALKGLRYCYLNGVGTERNKRLASEIDSRLNYLSVFGSIL